MCEYTGYDPILDLPAEFFEPLKRREEQDQQQPASTDVDAEQEENRKKIMEETMNWSHWPPGC